MCKHFNALQLEPSFFGAIFVSNYISLKTLTSAVDGATNITTKDTSYEINATNICTLYIEYMDTESLLFVTGNCSLRIS